MAGVVVEHRESRVSRQLRQRRVRVALAIATVEAVLLLVGVVPWWVAVVAAVGSVALYMRLGRGSSSPGVRSATWLAAASQLIVVLVPVAIMLLGLLAVIGVAVLATVALVLLLLDRR